MTKLGVTYTCGRGGQGGQAFCALLVYTGKDNHEGLSRFHRPGVTPFTGESAAYPHIFAVLQHLLDTRLTMLNGDWPFLCSLLGHLGHMATFPCPICIVGKQNLLRVSRYRQEGDLHSLEPRGRPALLRVRSDRIVPLPLHLYLGINNRIIFDVFAELMGEERVRTALDRVHTTHIPGCGGLTDLYTMNGPELQRFIKWCQPEAIFDAAAQAGDMDTALETKVRTLVFWMETLQARLLSTGDWTTQDLDDFRTFLTDIHAHWGEVTRQGAFPKLHMLRHALEFAERHGFLGRVSEAQIESFHAQFNLLYNHHHRNMTHNHSERVRRSLADAALRGVQPFAHAPPPAPLPFAQHPCTRLGRL